MSQFYAAEENICCGRRAYFRQIRIMQMHAERPYAHPAYLHPDPARQPGYFRRPSLQLIDPAQWPQQGINAHRPGRPGKNARVYSLNDAASVSAPGQPGHMNRPAEDRRVNATATRMHNGPDDSRMRKSAAGRVPPPRYRSPGPPRAGHHRQPAGGRPHPEDFGLVYRKRFHEPGLYFRLPYGAFASELNDQMEVSQHMEPSQPVDCLIQVYDRHLPVSAAQIAQAETGDAERAFEFRPLTSQKAQLLGISPTSGGRRSSPRTAAMADTLIQPLFRLQMLADPTTTEEADYADPGSPFPAGIDDHDRQIHQDI